MTSPTISNPERIAAAEARIVSLLLERDTHRQTRNATRIRNINVQIEGQRSWIRRALAVPPAAVGVTTPDSAAPAPA
jgi:hypothetical protein